MIRSLQLHRQQLLEAGRKFHMCDENFLKDAKRIISTEVSQILEITPREAEEYLCVRLEK
jgi:RNA polymerase-interacting CarD/CdnL/TRCF family regulator